MRRLIDEQPNLALNAQVLRSFFVPTPGVPAGRANAPYANLVAIAFSGMESTEALLQGDAMRRAEPIRSYELYREMQARKALIGKRRDKSPQGVAMSMAGAIDAWLASLDQFSVDALKPDAKELFDRIKELRTKARAAQDAVKAADA